MEVVLMVGIPGSGKTTLTAREFPHHASISLDKIKQFGREKKDHYVARYNAGTWPKIPDLGKFKSIQYVMMIDALEAGHDIVIDDTNITRAKRKIHIDLAQRYGASVIAIFFKNMEIAYEQNSGRRKPVPRFVLDQCCRKLEPPHADEGIDSIRIVC